MRPAFGNVPRTVRLLRPVLALLVASLLAGSPSARAAAPPGDAGAPPRESAKEGKSEGRNVRPSADPVKLRRSGTGGLVVGAVLIGGGAVLTGVGAAQWGIQARGEEGFAASSAPWVYATGAGLSVAFVGVGVLMFGLDQRAMADKIERKLSDAPPPPPADPAAIPAFAAAPRVPSGPAVGFALPAIRF